MNIRQKLNRAWQVVSPFIAVWAYASTLYLFVTVGLEARPGDLEPLPLILDVAFPLGAAILVWISERDTRAVSPYRQLIQAFLTAYALTLVAYYLTNAFGVGLNVRRLLAAIAISAPPIASVHSDWRLRQVRGSGPAPTE